MQKRPIELLISDIEKMQAWNVGGLILTCGVNIRRETGELIRLFRMWEEDKWNVMVFLGSFYRDVEDTNLIEDEAVAKVYRYIKTVNERVNQVALQA